MSDIPRLYRLDLQPSLDRIWDVLSSCLVDQTAGIKRYGTDNLKNPPNHDAARLVHREGRSSRSVPGRRPSERPIPFILP